MKEEMQLLSGVDKAGSDVEKYAIELDRLLLNKIVQATKMREQLHEFYRSLKTEEVMSSMYQTEDEDLLQDVDY